VRWCLFTVCPVGCSCPAIRRARGSPQTDGSDQCENHDGRSGHNIIVVNSQTSSSSSLSSSVEDCKRQPVRCGSDGTAAAAIRLIRPSSSLRRVVSNVVRPRSDWFARRTKIEKEH